MQFYLLSSFCCEFEDLNKKGSIHCNDHTLNCKLWCTAWGLHEVLTFMQDPTMNGV